MILPRTLREEVGDRAARTAVVENHGPKDRRVLIIHWHHFLAACLAHGIPAEREYK